MFVAFASLYALLVASVSYAQEPRLECTRAVFDVVNGPAIRSMKHLPDVSISPGIKEFEVPLQQYGLCGPKGIMGIYHSGTIVTACDEGEPPEVRQVDSDHFLVKRRGPGNVPGRVSVAVACRAMVP